MLQVDPGRLGVDLGLRLTEVPLFLVKQGGEALARDRKKVKELLSPQLLVRHDVFQKILQIFDPLQKKTVLV